MILQIYKRRGTSQGIEDVLLDSMAINDTAVPRQDEYIQIGNKEFHVKKVVHELYAGKIKVFVI